MPITFRMGTRNNPESFFIDLKSKIKPTADDLLLAMNIVKADIRESTAAGTDAEGAEFHPYSIKGPYYYKPFTAGGKLASGSAKQERASAHRLHNKLKQTPGYEGRPSRSGRSLVFSSYAAFKASFGRTTVDLMGVRGPHMLDAMVPSVQGDEGILGIYGNEAERASGHNFGSGRLPRRHFFGFSQKAKSEINRVLAERISNRLKKS